MSMNMTGIIDIVSSKSFSAIVVEGYDGVGKGRLLNELSKMLGVIPYRPDYNLWQKHDIRKSDRWKMSGFFWDIFSHFDINLETPMLFDRGCMSGAVYAKDISIVDDYKKLLRGSRVLHILVECSEEDFEKFQRVRNPGITEEELSKLKEEYKEYTDRYEEYLMRAEVNWIVFYNKFDLEESKRLAEQCEGCGHYNYGKCRHPLINIEVNPRHRRCRYSRDKEIQDREETRDGSEMQCV